MKKHLKRLAAPRTWPLERKKARFVVKPRSSHSAELCLPLGIILRDILGYAKTVKEVKNILNNEQVLVDGEQRKDPKFGIGLMDVLEIPKVKAAYRIILDKNGKLTLIKAENPKIKPCKVIGKRVLRKARLQVNLHDGRNLFTDKKVKLGDTLILELPEQNIAEELCLEKGNLVYLIGGKHTGESARVEEVNPKTIKVKIGEEFFETAKKFAFVIGKQKPIINLEK